jgi:hypothetical protein
LTRIRTLVAVLAIALPIPAAVAGCGGGDGNDEDPNQVLQETFNNDTKITSGNVAIDLSGSAEGTQSGSLTATVEGPFQTDEKNPNAFPQLDLTVKTSGSGAGESFNFDGGLVATEDNAFVDYQGQAYEVGSALFNRFAQSYEESQRKAQNEEGQGDQSLAEQFGVDPKSWLTNVSNEGTTDVDGTETIHIHGDANVPQIISDVQKIAQQSGGDDASLSQTDVDQIESAIKTASIDVYSGTTDKLLRKLALALTIEPPEGTDSEVSSVDANFSVTLSSVNEPQTITAPSGAKPLSDLLRQFGINLPLGQLSSGLNAGPPAGLESAGGSNSAYANCLKQATTPEDIQKCAEEAQ